MKAAILNRFGGAGEIEVADIPRPEPGAGEILIKTHTAGVGVWDPYEREGGFRSMGQQERFPYVLGSDGSGRVIALGSGVSEFESGDQVYAMCFLNPKGGTYAEYFVAKTSYTARIPEGMDMVQAGAFGVDGITAFSGLRRVLELEPDDRLLIFGASGGIGHLAIQLAKRIGASVVAVGSGPDGTAFAEELGADGAVDGRAPGVVDQVRQAAEKPFDVALLTAGGEIAAELLSTVKDGGRVAWPHGIADPPELSRGITGGGYNGEGGGAFLAELNALVERSPFEVRISESFPVEAAAEAHRRVSQHHLGKLVLRID